MATGKKSFVLYCDYESIFEKLNNDEAGKLIKHIFKYVNDKNPEAEDRIIDIVFEPIKQHLKRDLKKWEKYIDKQRENGKKGGRPESQKTQAFFQKPKKADSVNVSVSVKQQEAFLKNNIRKEKFCMAKSLSMSDLDKIQQQFLFDISGRDIKDLWSYFETVFNSGAYNGMIKKMVL